MLWLLVMVVLIMRASGPRIAILSIWWGLIVQRPAERQVSKMGECVAMSILPLMALE